MFLQNPTAQINGQETPTEFNFSSSTRNAYAQEERDGIYEFIGEGKILTNNRGEKTSNPTLKYFFKRV